MGKGVGGGVSGSGSPSASLWSDLVWLLLVFGVCVIGH